MPIHPLPASLFSTLLEWIDGGRTFALVTVMRDAGSTPRKAGTRAIVDAAGEMWGTIGGGILESDARAAAMEALHTGRAELFEFPFSGASARGDAPVCGGAMRVLVDPRPAQHRAAFALAASDLANRRRGVMATLVSAHIQVVEMAWLPDRHLPRWGAAAERAVERARSRQCSQYFFEAVSDAGCEWNLEGLAEPVGPVPLLLIAGGGHVGQALARQACLLGWRVVAIEDRPEFSDPSLYPPAVDVRRGRFRELLPEWPLNRDTYVAIVGRGHKVDGDALAAVIREPVGYVGMMGSRRKVALMRREFLESGAATAEQFDRVRAPIGLDVGAETVEEIAASIVAELVAVRRGRRARRVVD